MLDGKRLEEFEDFQECRVNNHRIEIEELESDRIIDSGMIERLEDPDFVVVNGTAYKMDSYLFFHRASSE